MNYLEAQNDALLETMNELFKCNIELKAQVAILKFEISELKKTYNAYAIHCPAISSDT